MRSQKFLLITAVGHLICTSVSGAPTTPPSSVQTLISTAQNLTIEDAVRIALDRNLELKQRKLSLDSAQINYDNAWDTMYMPSVSMTFSSDSESTIARVPGTPASRNVEGGLSKGFPNSNLQLALGSYTLFNFFRDQLAFDNAKMQFERTKQQYEEGKRSIRFRVVNAYFRARTDQEKLDAAKRSVDMSFAILELVKSRKKLSQATDDEVSSSSVDYLTAKTAYEQQAQAEFESVANLNLLLDTDIQQKFILVSGIKFSPLKLGAQDAIKIFTQTGPTLRDANLSLKVAENNLELAQKNRLPLPTIGFSGMTVGYTRNYAAGANSLTNPQQGSAPGGQFNIQAVVSLTLPLFGPGGFLGSRTVGLSHIQRDNSEITVNTVMNTASFEILRKVEGIRREETQLKSVKEIFDSSLKLLESVFAKASGEKVNRLEARDAISQERFSEAGYLDALLQHLSDKLALAEFLGVDHLPNEEEF